MEIINKDVNVALQRANHFLLGGYISGPIRMILGIVQTIINVVAAVFFCLGSLCFHIENNSHMFFENAKRGLLHVTRGFVEMLPFSEMCLDCVVEGWVELVDSHPYHFEIVHEYEHLTTMSVFAEICC